MTVIDQLRFSSASGTYRQTWDVPMFINSMCYAPDGRTLVTGHNDGKARLWEVKSGALLQELEVSQWSVYAVAVAPDNRTLAVDGATGGVQLWDMTRAQKLRVLSGKNAIQTLAFSSTGLLAASSDGEISVWQVASGRLLHRMTGETWVAFAEDGKTTVTATHDALRWRDSLNGALLREVLVPNPMRQLPAPRHGRISWLPIVSGFFFVPRTILSPDGSLAATLYTDGSIGLWETRTGEMRRLLKGFNRANVMGGGVTIFAFAPDGQRLVCGNQTGEVALWNVNPTKSFPKAVT